MARRYVEQTSFRKNPRGLPNFERIKLKLNFHKLKNFLSNFKGRDLSTFYIRRGYYKFFFFFGVDNKGIQEFKDMVSSNSIPLGLSSTGSYINDGKNKGWLYEVLEKESFFLSEYEYFRIGNNLNYELNKFITGINPKHKNVQETGNKVESVKKFLEEIINE